MLLLFLGLTILPGVIASHIDMPHNENACAQDFDIDDKDLSKTNDGISTL